MDAARLVFLEKGYAGSTMTRIAEAGGVVVETIYRSFGGKAGLFRAVVEGAGCRRRRTRLGPTGGASGDPAGDQRARPAPPARAVRENAAGNPCMDAPSNEIARRCGSLRPVACGCGEAIGGLPARRHGTLRADHGQ
ncbi:MAG: helix-turn-helix transcriptional regulator [Actinobacteria bacterium]|nr:helix-turn-helix transcriptional regulator [Actinomycetota bacterium]